MKYKLTSNAKIVNNTTLYQIVALKDFADVKAGYLGGYIESENNLSQEGNCWVYDNASVSGYARVSDGSQVHGNARIYGNAQVSDTALVNGNAWVSDDAQIHGNAWVHGNAQVSDDVQIYDNAWVYGNARVSDGAQVYGDAWVYDNARVYGKARVYDNAWVHGNAQVSDDAQIRGNSQVSATAQVYGNTQVRGNAQVSAAAQVHGNAQVFGDAKIAQSQHIKYNRVISDITDIKHNLAENIEAQTGLVVFNTELYCYTYVREDLSSLHDSELKYTVGEYISVDNVELDQTVSCASGLHVSNAQYWNSQGGGVRLLCKVNLNDIIAVQEGKIRCKRLFVIGVCDGVVF